MVKFKKLRWKNFLSTGDYFNELPLDENNSSIITGKNGEGKCLVPLTKLVIKFKNSTAHIKFLSIKNLRPYFSNGVYSVNIIDIVKFYEMYPKCIGSIEVETPRGFKTIEGAQCTARNSTSIFIKTENEKELEGSPDHLIMVKTNDGLFEWHKLQDLSIGDTIVTISGHEKIIDKFFIDLNQDLYDLQVQDVKCFFANGILSHNSTFIDALSFVLFGKAHRNINKPQLVNVINGKKAIVEVEFETSENNQYKIVRGIKPNVFEIYHNDKLINQDPSVRDYQKHLEQNIIKFNYKSFHQIVVLGSSSFIPFMELSAAHRREIIEDLLDIGIFSRMNQILKEDLQKAKADLKEIEYKKQTSFNNINTLGLAIESIENGLRNKNDVSIQSLINEHVEKIKEYENKIQYIDNDKEKNTVNSIKKAKKQLKTIENNIYSFKNNIKQRLELIEFLKHNDECPTCHQEIDDDFKDNEITSLIELGKEDSINYENEVKTKNEINNEILDLENFQQSIFEIQNKNKEIESFIKYHEEEIERLHKKLLEEESNNKLDDKNETIGNLKDKLNIELQNHSTLKKEYSKLNEEIFNLTICFELLKDTGIKAKIIKEYIPVINTMLNQYLEQLNFFVSFNFDENFNENIKSRYLDSFSYSSFSEGEKQRINLALLFTWRAIARLKNSVSTNLLILDETFDSSLDAEGIDNLLKILTGIESENNTNTFIISHNANVSESEYFDARFEVFKNNNFSYIKETDSTTDE